MGGRGGGKTRSGAEAIRAWIESERCGRVALVGRTPADVRDVMIEGPSGLCKLRWRSRFRPDYKPALRRIEWPNGARAFIYSSAEPGDLEGPQHDGAWGDEIRNWYNLEETWDALLLGVRLGQDPRIVLTTTPTAHPVIRKLVEEAETPGGKTAISRMTTEDNRANLAPTFFRKIVERYKGTRLERTMILGLMDKEVEGALWKWKMIDGNRVDAAPPLVRIVVAIDPAVSSTEESDETGIVVVGKGTDDRAYVLADLSGRYTPNEWGTKAIQAYRFHKADRIIAEKNQGGDLVEANVRAVDRDVAYEGVHAKRGKMLRAEPVSALYEQDRVKHVGAFPVLETQMTTWVQGEESPDHLDAMVYGVRAILLPDGEEDAEAWIG